MNLLKLCHYLCTDFQEKKHVASKWTQFVQQHKPHWKPGQWHYVCSKHFAAEDFDKTGQTTRVRENAVPSVFQSLPQKHSTMNTEHNYCQMRHRSRQSTKHSHCQMTRKSRVSIHSFPEHNYCATQSPRTVSRCFTTNNEQIARQRKRIKVLQQRVRRMKKGEVNE